MRYLCLVYLDEHALAALSPAAHAVFDAECRDYHEQLQHSGELIVGETLQSVLSTTSLQRSEQPQWEREDLQDDRLRLIFTCCQPALPADAQVALTLREVCDLKTEEIARTFLASPSTFAQRIVRAKQTIREAAIPYRVPTRGAPGAAG